MELVPWQISTAYLSKRLMNWNRLEHRQREVNQCKEITSQGEAIVDHNLTVARKLRNSAINTVSGIVSTWIYSI